MVDNPDGIVIDHEVHIGNPPDAGLLAPAIARIPAPVRTHPRAVAADRGYGEAKVDADLTALVVKRAAIHRKGRPGAARRTHEQTRSFRKTGQVAHRLRR